MNVVSITPMESENTQQTTQPTPPDVEQRPHTIEVHGRSWEDPYFWLRDKEDEQVIDYLNRENAYTETVMQHTKQLQTKLFEEFKGRINEDDQSVPVKRKEYYYYYRTEKGKDYRIFCRKYQSMDNEEQIILDVNELAKDKEYTSLGSFDISPDHSKLLYTVDYSGYEDYDAYIKYLEEDRSELIVKDTGGMANWADENNIYYNLTDDIHRSYRLMYRQLQTDNDDKIVYEEPNQEFSLWPFKSTDEKFMFLMSHGRESDVIRYINIKGNPLVVTKFNNQIDQVEYRIDHHEDYFYFITSKDAINFKFCKTPVGQNTEDNWFVLVDHNPTVRLVDITMFKDFGALSYRENGYQDIRVFSMPGFEDHTIKLPETSHSVRLGNNPNFDTDYIRLNYSSMVTPNSVFDYYVAEKNLVQKKQEEVKDYDAMHYITRREYAFARDGTKIPLSIAYKKGISRPAPVLLYGYGSYGFSVDPSFNANRISLLERGMIFVIAHIRGGGEMGKPWYHDGKLMNKKNTFTDFIDAAKYLQTAGYATKDTLSIMGGSAGGLLMGAVVNMAPELFHTVVARVPFVDVISTMLDDSIPLTTFEFLEWGNPSASKEAFDYMLSYSPYDQVGSVSTDYPEILITAGLNDPRVHYWEPAKWTAKLRDIKTDDNRLLLKTNMGAGHGGASGRYEHMKEMAFIYSFLIDSLEMDLE